ncbi:MAG: NAD(P)H-hydrate dehydratase [Saprospiraceae bacterium]
MHIYNGKESKLWDEYSLEDQALFSWDLMERASKKLTEKILNIYSDMDLHFYVVVGPGNNGGDGLAIARMLNEQFRDVCVVLLQTKGSPEYEQNYALIKSKSGIKICSLKEFENASLKKGVFIDAIFGNGLNRKPDGKNEKAISFINSSNYPVISIDLPSGMIPDHLPDWEIVKATHTIMIQNVKLSSLFEEGGQYYGNCHMVDIGLSQSFLKTHPSDKVYITQTTINPFLKTRTVFSHKGEFGHAALACGSESMIGAAILSVKACLKSGVGLVTCFVPECGYEIMQMSCPESMCISDINDRHLKSVEIKDTFDAVGIGCGIGNNPAIRDWLIDVFKKLKGPGLVLDADALNIISQYNIKIPEGAIITPHPKEFDRLFGHSKTGYERYLLQVKMAKLHKINIVLKGHFTCFVNDEGESWFNSTGNPGMACGGSGDVLTGLITGILAQDFTIDEAVILALYLHGYAGDLAAASLSQEAMTSMDIINYLGQAWKECHALKNSGTNIEK